MKKLSFFYLNLFLAISYFYNLSYATQGFIEEVYKDQDFKNSLPKLENLSINHLGELYITPSYKELFNMPDALAIWSIYQDNDSIYVTTANPGRVFKLDPQNNKFNLLYKSNSFASITILKNPENNNFYLANSQKSELLIFDENFEKIKEVISFDEKYIWKMLFDVNKKKLYVVTGLKACLYEIDLSNQNKKTKLVEIDEESHILSLAQNNEILYLGTSNSVLYEYHLDQQKLKSIYSSETGEIKDILFDPQSKNIYFIVSQIIYEIELKKDPAASLDKNKKIQNERKNLYPKTSPNSLIQINSDGQFKEIFSKLEHRFVSLAINPKTNYLYLGTGNEAIVFEINLNSIDNENSQKDIQAYINFPESQITQIHFDTKNNHLYVGTSNLAKLFKSDLEKKETASYTSKIIDLNKIVDWGKIIIFHLDKEKEEDISKYINVEVRSGNTKKINKTWSDWKKVNINTENLNISSQCLQYKITFLQNYPIMQGIELLFITYSSEYDIPKIKSISLEKNQIINTSPNITTPTHTTYTSDNTQNNPNQENPDINTNESNLILSKSENFNLILKWELSNNTNMNELLYSIFYRKRNQQDWTPLVYSIPNNYYLLDESRFPDEEYQFKIMMINKYSKKYRSYKVSSFFIFDSSPPEYIAIEVLDKSDYYLIKGSMEDFSHIHSVFYSLNSNDWVYIEALDKIYDSFKEEFQFKIKKSDLNKDQYSENFVILKGFDHNNNFNLKKLIFN